MVLTEANSPNRYLLLQVLRSYLMIDSFSAMEVHTEDTIKDGQKEIENFKRLIDVRNFSYIFLDID